MTNPDQSFPEAPQEPIHISEIVGTPEDVIGVEPDPRRDFFNRQVNLTDEIQDIDRRREELRREWTDNPASVPDIDEKMEVLNKASLEARAEKNKLRMDTGEPE